MNHSRFLRVACALLCVLAASVAMDAAAQDGARQLRLHGSNTIGQRLAPALVRAWASSDGYTEVSSAVPAEDELSIVLEKDAQRLVVEIRAHGTGTGVADLKSGQTDLWMASRPVAAAEIADLIAMGKLDTPEREHVIALDGVAVIVHANNPLARLSLTQARDIFSGAVRDWKQLGATPGAIAVYARDDRSGTYDSFKNLVLRDRPLVAGAKRFESNEALANRVAADTRAIGFVSVSSVGTSKAVAIADAGTRALLPTALTVATEDYLLSRRLFLYDTAKAPLVARELVEFALSEVGQRVVEKNGFVAQNVVALTLPERVDVSAEYLSLTRDARRLTLNFRFGSGVAFLDNKSTRDVERLAAFLRMPINRGADLMLIGFADGNEIIPYQALSLSNDRADFVAQELVSRGLPPRRVRGMGNAAPVAADDTDAGRYKNRRVEVWIRAQQDSVAALGAK